MSHIFTVVLTALRVLGNRCAPLEHETVLCVLSVQLLASAKRRWSILPWRCNDVLILHLTGRIQLQLMLLFSMVGCEASVDADMDCAADLKANLAPHQTGSLWAPR